MSINTNGVERKEAVYYEQNNNNSVSTNKTTSTVPMTSGKMEGPGEQTSYGNTVQKITTKAATLDYSNFGGKGQATKAASIASEAIDTVNDCLKNLQNKYPGARVELDEFPNPAEYSKKTYGKDGAFKLWEQEVKNWRNNCMTSINNCENISHAQVTNDAANRVINTVVMTYSDLKGGQKQVVDQLIQLGYLTAEGFNFLAEKMDNDVNKIVSYVRKAANQIMANDNRNAQALGDLVNTRADKLDDHIGYVHQDLSDTIVSAAIMLYDQAEENRTDVKKFVAKEAQLLGEMNINNAKETQELAASSQRISDNLDASGTSEYVTDKMGQFRETIIGSKIPHEAKMKLLDKLEKLSTEIYISNGELEDMEKFINGVINNLQN